MQLQRVAMKLQIRRDLCVRIVSRDAPQRKGAGCMLALFA